MHQIEEILKQLNEQSAEIQPGTVQLLTNIQQRLMHRSGSQQTETNAATPVEPTKQATAGQNHEAEAEELRLAQEDHPSAAVPESNPARNSAGFHSADIAATGMNSGVPTEASATETLSPLLQSIMDANRRLRSDQRQAVAQPRFLGNSRPVAKPASVNASYGIADFHDLETPTTIQHYVVDHQHPTGQTASTSSGSAGDYREHATVSGLGGGLDIDEFPAETPIFPPTSSFEEDWETHQRAASMSLKFPIKDTDNDSITSGEGSATESIQRPAVDTNKPPIPHFERAKTPVPPKDRQSVPEPQRSEAKPSTAVGRSRPEPRTLDEGPALPIFDSVWFRRSAPNSSIAHIVDSLLRKVPPTAPATLQFTHSLESSTEGHLFTTQIAWELSRRIEGDVLLVDGDFLYREISRQLENVYCSGLSDILNREEPVSSLVRNTGVDRLYWLPSGQSDISFRNTSAEQWSRLSAELKRRFQYICIYAGAAEEKVASTWGRFCDFTFLLASMSDNLGPETQSLVAHMRRVDCRVAGLITIE